MFLQIRKRDVNKALVRASHAIGWDLKQNGGVYSVEPLQNVGNLIFISCFDKQGKKCSKICISL